MPLTKDRSTPRRAGDQFEFPVAQGANIFAGALVVMDAGYAEPGSVATGLIAVGRAEEQADNTLGQDGDITVKVTRGVFRYQKSAQGDEITLADLEQPCYIVDDQTVAKTAGIVQGSATRSPAGIVRDVDADGVWVEIPLAALVLIQLPPEEPPG